LKSSAKSGNLKLLLVAPVSENYPDFAEFTVWVNWRKRKGYATVRLSDGSIREAEIHWYEATGIGKREFKIKRYIDTQP
jgi:hypothetical protein